MPDNDPARRYHQCRRVQPCECPPLRRHSHCLPQRLSSQKLLSHQSQGYTIRRGLRARAITKSRVPRAAPGMVCFQNLPAPPMSACSPGFPLPPCIPSILPQRYQVWRPALPRQAPWPSQRHAFLCSSICPLEAIPSWRTWEVPPHKYDGDARQGGMPLCDLPVRCQPSPAVCLYPREPYIQLLAVP